MDKQRHIKRHKVRLIDDNKVDGRTRRKERRGRSDEAAMRK